MEPRPSFHPEVPSIARTYDYLLGGKDNAACAQWRPDGDPGELTPYQRLIVAGVGVK